MPSKSALQPLRISEIPEVGELARAIWRHHYASIISGAQIEYMLRNKYTPMDLEPYVGAPDRWFDVLRVENAPSGFLRTSRAGQDELKLEEIYVVKDLRGKGYGKLLLDRAESLARAQHCSTMFLHVNRANEGAVAVYQWFRHGRLPHGEVTCRSGARSIKLIENPDGKSKDRDGTAAG